MNNKHIVMASKLAAMVSAIVGTTGSALAATDNAVAQDLEEIVVTAQKRSENIQDVAIAITAMSGRELAAQQIRNAEDLIGMVPNLSVQSTLGDTTPIYSIRGVTAWDYSITQNGPVAVYYDEVYKGNFAIQGLNYFDLERVEVLRGPQGTLYGRNTTGGAINVVSKKPDFETGGYVKVGYGNYDRYLVEGALQTAVSETLAVRIAGIWEDARGWYKNIAPGQPNLSSTDQYALRGTVLFKPNDTFDLTVRASTSRMNPTQMARSDTPFNAGTGSPYYPALGVNGQILQPYPVGREGLSMRETNNPNVRHRKTDSDAVSVTANIALSPALSLTSITSWDKGKINLANDADGAPIRFVEVEYIADSKQITQDLRLASSFSGPFNFIAGAYYLREKLGASNSNRFGLDIDTNADGVLNAQDCISGAFFIGCSYTNNFDQKKTSYALYTDATLAVADGLVLRGGLRYTKDKGRQYNLESNILGDTYVNGAPGVVIFNIIPKTSQSFNDNNVSGKIGLEYTPREHLLLYANASTGYRGASFNAQALFSPLDVSTAKPEKITAFEGGFKSQLMAGRLIVNGALFNYNFKNQQNVDFDSATFAQPLVNIPKSRIRGAELDITARLADSLTFRSGLGFLDTKVIRGSSGGIDTRGKRLVNAPKVTWSPSLTWEQPVTDQWKLRTSLSGAYVSRIYFDPTNAENTSAGSYFKMDGNVRVSDAEDRYAVTFWMKNITNKLIYVDRVDGIAFGNYLANNLAPPRTYGVTFEVQF